MSAGSITTDLASAQNDFDAVDAIVAGWVNSYVLLGSATTTANGAQFARDGGNAASGTLITRLQTTLRNLQGQHKGVAQ